MGSDDFNRDDSKETTALINTGIDSSENLETVYTSDIEINMDSFVDQLNVGLFHYLITLSCGLCYSTGAAVLNAISFVIITACDLNMTIHNRGLLSIATVIGMIIGSVTMGRLGDVIGRKIVLIIVILCNIIATVASAFAYNFDMIIGLGFVNGLGLGGNFANCHTYLIEFFPRSYRGISVASMTAFLIFGGIYSCGMAYFILSHPFYNPFGIIYFTHWRLYLLVCILPTAISLLMLFWLPDSIRFLIRKKQKRKLIQVLYQINRINSWCNKSITDYKLMVDEQLIETIIRKEEMESEDKPQLNLISQFKMFNQPPWRKRMWLLVLSWFGFCYAFHGLRQWLPVLIAFYIRGNSCWLGWHSSYASQFINYSSFHVSNSSICVHGSNLQATIQNIILGNILAAPVAILCILLINRVGRKRLFCSISMLSGIFVFFIVALDKTLSTEIFACAFTTVAINGWIPLELWTAELFPTELRSTAVGILNLVSSLGFLICITTFTLLFHSSCPGSLLLPAILCVLSGLVGCLLPDTSNSDIS